MASPGPLDFEVAIIGGGAMGLACAALLAQSGRSLVLFEAAPRFGQEASSRNSGVVHAGIYYPEGSLKARLCVRGRQLLYARAARSGIAHQKLGKLIVAGDASELPALLELRERAQNNGVSLQLLDQAQVRALEPSLAVRAALWSPETGIVDAHELLADYAREAREHSAELLTGHRVVGLRQLTDRYQLDVTSGAGAEPFSIQVRSVVNAAGLFAPEVASLAGLDVAALGFIHHPCKGDYFRLRAGAAPELSHLVYPLPSAAGLGVHLTLDLSGAIHAGPDAMYCAAPSYAVDPNKASDFARAVARYLPGVTAADFTPAYAGIRPKLQGPGQAFRDFVIEAASAHGLPGLINLFGIESPGLTASEAIAERVVGLIRPA